MNFKIGQEVVCIKTHSQSAVKEGEIYVVKDMKITCCKFLALDVGVYSTSLYWQCAKCEGRTLSDGIWWINSSLFKPLDELYNEELNEELNEIFSKQPYEL